MKAFSFDQNYLLKGCHGKGGKRVAGTMRGQERTDAPRDAEGMPTKYVHMDLVNSTQYHLPDALCPITPEVEQQLLEHGPYTEPFSLIIPHFDPVNVRLSLWEFFVDHVQLYLNEMEEAGVAPHELPDETIAKATVRRPNSHPVPAHMSFLSPVLNTKTQYYSDMINIIAHLIKHVSELRLYNHTLQRTQHVFLFLAWTGGHHGGHASDRRRAIRRTIARPEEEILQDLPACPHRQRLMA